MNSVQSHPSAALLGVANKPPLTWELPQPKRPIALKVATLLDGKGGTLRGTWSSSPATRSNALAGRSRRGPKSTISAA